MQDPPPNGSLSGHKHLVTLWTFVTERYRREERNCMVDGAGFPLPVDLVRALDWLRAHLSEPIDLQKLAEVAGVRPRTLETHFRTFLKATPLGWVRRMRLTKLDVSWSKGACMQQ